MFELMSTLHTKLEGFRTQISKDSSEQSDAVPCVQLMTADVQAGRGGGLPGPQPMAMHIHNACAVLYDIILKSFERLKGETKGMMYWEPPLKPETFLPLSGDSRLFPPFLLLRFLPHLASQAQ